MMRLCLAQINCRVGDFDGNRSQVGRALREAEADLVVFPELTLSGYPPEDLLYRPEFLKDATKCLSALASETGSAMAIVGFPESFKGKVFNSAALLQGGRRVGVYRKMLLPNYSVFDEKRYFTPGLKPLVFSMGPYRVGLTICEDIWMTGGPVEALLSQGVDLLVNVSASPFYRHKIREREKVAVKLAKRGRCHVAYCNLVGGQDELVFDGGSFVITPKGKVAVRARQFREELLFFDLPAPAIFHHSRRAKNNAKLRWKLKIRELLPVQMAPPMAPVEEVFEALSLGLKDYALKNGFQRAVIGLSGGIDSAFVAALAVEALGVKNVLGISLPSIYSSSETRSDARQVAENLAINFREIPIQAMVDGFKFLIAADAGGIPENVAEENLQARIRGNLLMYYSNKFNRLLLSTGNKSEVSTGYCTLYGDMCGGFSPIKDVPKTLVYELVEYYNRRRGREIIPASTVSRPPTAELRAGQKDTDSLPPYSVLDAILESHVEDRKPAAAIVKKGFSKEMVREVLSKLYQSEYKRRQASPGIKITHLAFGKDWRMPISNAYKGGF